MLNTVSGSNPEKQTQSTNRTGNSTSNDFFKINDSNLKRQPKYSHLSNISSMVKNLNNLNLNVNQNPKGNKKGISALNGNTKILNMRASTLSNANTNTSSVTNSGTSNTTNIVNNNINLNYNKVSINMNINSNVNSKISSIVNNASNKSSASKPQNFTSVTSAINNNKNQQKSDFINIIEFDNKINNRNQISPLKSKFRQSSRYNLNDQLISFNSLDLNSLGKKFQIIKNSNKHESSHVNTQQSQYSNSTNSTNLNNLQNSNYIPLSNQNTYMSKNSKNEKMYNLYVGNNNIYNMNNISKVKKNILNLNGKNLPSIRGLKFIKRGITHTQTSNTGNYLNTYSNNNDSIDYLLTTNSREDLHNINKNKFNNFINAKNNFTSSNVYLQTETNDRTNGDTRKKLNDIFNSTFSSRLSMSTKKPTKATSETRRSPSSQVNENKNSSRILNSTLGKIKDKVKDLYYKDYMSKVGVK